MKNQQGIIVTRPIVSESQVYNHLVELDVHKSIRVDGVSPFVLLNCARVLSKPLCYIFNKSLSGGIRQAKWKQANITSIF